LDFEDRWSSLEQSDNPFAVVVMAQLKAREKRRDHRGRLHWKLSLVKGLYRRGLSKNDILELFRFIDWVMDLPAELEQIFKQELSRFEEELKMPYITSIERSGFARGKKEGKKEGLEQGLERGLEHGLERGLVQGSIQGIRKAVLDVVEARFGAAPPHLIQALDGIEDTSRLRALLKKAAVADSAGEFVRVAEAKPFP